MSEKNGWMEKDAPVSGVGSLRHPRQGGGHESGLIHNFKTGPAIEWLSGEWKIEFHENHHKRVDESIADSTKVC